MSKIFLSYRREDSAAYAGRLYDRLVGHFGKDRVFMDIEGIEPGEDFVDVITDSVGASSVLIVLIGRQWDSVPEPEGVRRLDNAEDFVRLEISAALDNKIRVIPVLVGGASMPRAQDLPEPLQPLARRHAIEIADTRFHGDVDRLVEVIERSLTAAQEQDAQSVAADAASRDIGPPQTVQASISDKLSDRSLALDARGKREIPSPEQRLESQNSALDAESLGRPEAEVRASDAKLKIVLGVVGVVVVVIGLGFLTLRNSTDPAPVNEPRRKVPMGGAYTGPPIKLRGQDTFPETTVHSAAFRAVAEGLKTMTGGTIQLEWLRAGAVVPAFQAMDAVAKGVVDSAWISPSYFYGKNIAFELIAAPPFGPNPSRYAQWRMDKGANSLIDPLYRSFKVTSIFCGVLGPYADLWSRSKIRAPSDLSGRKIRAVGITAEIFAKAGATGVQLPGGEIYPAMERGVIDGINFGDPAFGAALGLDQVARFLYFPGAITPSAGLDLIVNADKWDQLPREAQAAFEGACERNVQEMLVKNDAEQRVALSGLVSKKVQVERLPDDVVSALRTAWQKLAAEKYSDPLSRRLLESSRSYGEAG